MTNFNCQSLPVNLDGDTPIITTLLDTDIYKLLMQQVIWLEHPRTEVTFKVINRSGSVRLSDTIPEVELIRELDRMRALRFSDEELSWLKSSRFNGEEAIIRDDYLNWLRDFRLPEYQLTKNNGDYELNFSGPWPLVTLWEIPILSILSELRSRAGVKQLAADERIQLYDSANEILNAKIERLAGLPKLGIADFGTRRRHSYAWQRHCLKRMKEGLGTRFTGTSNVALAKELQLQPIGTNGHEMPMVIAALAEDDHALLHSPYHVLESWKRYYGGNLLIVLPDTYGTTGFLNHAPDWLADWVGFRPDSKEPIEAGNEIINWWRNANCDPGSKRLIFSDDLDVAKIEEISSYFQDRTGLAFGWGTRLTNDLTLASDPFNAQFRAASLVCKVSEVNGRAAVKLSDNPKKISGAAQEVDRYLRVFGLEEYADGLSLVS